MKIGVFVCHCGSNIEATVDTAAVAKMAREYPDVVFSEDSMYTCSEPGQENIIRKALSQTENPPLRLMIIQSADQIERLNIDNVTAYCMVDGEADEVRYYKMKERTT